MIFNDTKIAFQHLTNWHVLKSYWLFLFISSRRVQRIIVPIIHKAIDFKLPVSFIFSPLYNHFYGGKTLDDTIQNIRNIAKRHVYTVLHYGAESKKTEHEFDKVFQKTIESIEFAHEHLKVKVIASKITGLGDAHLLEKIQQKQILTDIEQKAFEKLQIRINAICELAAKYHVSVYWDAEETWIQNVIDDIVEQQMQKYNIQWPCIFNTVQMYRTDRMGYLELLIKRGQELNFKPGIKIVRGAYFEKENQIAKKQGKPSPIHVSKELTDEAFDAAAELCLQHVKNVGICIATHNEASVSKITQRMRELGIKNNNVNVWFAQLYGMSDHISNNLANLLYNVAKYMPYGKQKEAIHYLIRRAEENSSSANMVNREIEILKAEIFRRSLTASIK